MKRKIIVVEIVTGTAPRTWLGTNLIRIYRTGEPTPIRYSLTERNYWRAVGMQLKLAGFVKEKEK